MNTKIVRWALAGLSVATAAGIVLLAQNGDSSAQGSDPAPTTVLLPMPAPMDLASVMTGFDGIGECVRLGPFPRGSLFDGTHIWTTESSSFREKLLRVDPDTLSVLQAITIGANLNDVAYDGEFIWVSVFAAGRVAKVRASDGFLVGTFPVNSPADNSHPSPTSIAVDGDVLWAATSGNLSISTLSLDTGDVLETFFMGSVIPDVLPMPEGIWVSMVSPDRVVLLDRDTGAELASCIAGALPTALVAVNDEIWVSNHHGGTVSIIDRATCTVIATVPVGILPRESVFDGTHVWVCNQESETVSRINRFTLAVVDFPSFGGDPGWPVIVGEHLYVVNHFPDGTLCRVAHVPPDRGCVLQFFDNFEHDTVGFPPSNWNHQPQNPPATEAFVGLAGPDLSGLDLAKSVAFVDTDPGLGVQVSRLLTQSYTGRLALEWSERHDTLDDYLRMTPGGFFVVMAGNDPNHPQFRGWITLASRDQRGDINIPVMQWDPNRWYRLRVEIDVPAQTFDFFVDGTLMISDVRFRDPAAVISGVRFETGGLSFSPQQGTRSWIDNFQEFDCTPSESPSVEVVEAGMSGPETFRVKVDGDFPGVLGEYRVDLTINNTVIQAWFDAGQSGEQDLEINLADLGVPRFTDHQEFDVSVFVRAGAVDGNTAFDSVFIPIPAIVVQGIFTEGGHGGLDDYFGDRGYSVTQPYPTLYALEYDPDALRLRASAGRLAALIEIIIGPSPTSYADRVDIIGHSKGGLVARMYLKLHARNDELVRKLVLAATPNTGSAFAALSLGFAPYRELRPTSPWWRPTKARPFFSHHYGRNRQLLELNNTAMPAWLQYYLLYGDFIPTPTTATRLLPDFTGNAVGDSIVPTWSALGYEIINEAVGPAAVSLRGDRISAFSVHPPSGETSFPLSLHGGFLDRHEAAVFEIIRAQANQ